MCLKHNFNIPLIFPLFYILFALSLENAVCLALTGTPPFAGATAAGAPGSQLPHGSFWRERWAAACTVCTALSPKLLLCEFCLVQARQRLCAFITPRKGRLPFKWRQNTFFPPWLPKEYMLLQECRAQWTRESNWVRGCFKRPRGLSHPLLIVFVRKRVQSQRDARLNIHRLSDDKEKCHKMYRCRLFRQWPCPPVQVSSLLWDCPQGCPAVAEQSRMPWTS